MLTIYDLFYVRCDPSRFICLYIHAVVLYRPYTVVLVLRGTAETDDILVDLAAQYIPFEEGFAHKVRMYRITCVYVDLCLRT